MSLVDVYNKNFGPENGTKQAANEEAPKLTNEQIEEALSKMSDEEMKQLAKEVAETQSSEKTAEAQKEAEELFAGGQIFARGFMQELNQGEKTATERFTEHLNKASEKKSA